MTASIKDLSEQLAKLYGVDACITMPATMNRHVVWLAEDSGRIAELADDNGADTYHDVLDIGDKDSVSCSYVTANEYFSIFENYANHPTKHDAARMARVRCL